MIQIGNFVNLDDNIVVKPNGGGYWSYPSQQGLIQGSLFNVSNLTVGASYDVYYIERLVCYDTTVATISFYDYNSAGVDGTAEICKNEPYNLYQALSGNITLGGEWYLGGSSISSSQVVISIPGQYPYYYVIINTDCPNDTAFVDIAVHDCGGFPDISTTKQDFQNISISPNPASNHLKIKSSPNTSALKLEMIDMNGRIVIIKNNILNNATEIVLSIGHLEKGIYSLRIYNDEGQNMHKIVKQ